MSATSLIGYPHVSRVHIKKKITSSGEHIFKVPSCNPWGVSSVQLYINGAASVTVSTNDHSEEDYTANTAGEASEFVDWSYGSATTSGKYIIQQPHHYLKFTVTCPTPVTDYVSIVVRV
jgi:hypothetical protein